MVLATSFWGSGQGAHGLWRLTQKGELRELLRSFYSGRPSKPSPNTLPGKGIAIDEGLAVDPQGRIWFSYLEEGFPRTSKAYQMDDSFKTLKRLPNEARGGLSQGPLIYSDQLPSNFDKEDPKALGERACFDGKGNRYFMVGKSGVLKEEAGTRRITTWVR